MSKILFDDGQDIYFAQDYEDETDTVLVTVWKRMDDMEHGMILMGYRFPNIPESFESPYLSWRNLYCCGSWPFHESILDTAVQEGTKLFASRRQAVRTYDQMELPTFEDVRQSFEILKASFPTGVYGAKETIPIDDNLYFFRSYICREGSIADYFDLDKVFEHYRKLGVNLQPFESEIWRLCSVEIKTYGTEWAPFSYFREGKSPAQFVTTGLLLGYPIESTASIILH